MELVAVAIDAVDPHVFDLDRGQGGGDVDAVRHAPARGVDQHALDMHDSRGVLDIDRARGGAVAGVAGLRQGDIAADDLDIAPADQIGVADLLLGRQLEDVVLVRLQVVGGVPRPEDQGDRLGQRRRRPAQLVGGDARGGGQDGRGGRRGRDQVGVGLGLGADLDGQGLNSGRAQKQGLRLGRRAAVHHPVRRGDEARRIDDRRQARDIGQEHAPGEVVAGQGIGLGAGEHRLVQGLLHLRLHVPGAAEIEGGAQQWDDGQGGDRGEHGHSARAVARTASCVPEQVAEPDGPTASRRPRSHPRLPGYVNPGRNLTVALLMNSERT